MAFFFFHESIYQVVVKMEGDRVAQKEPKDLEAKTASFHKYFNEHGPFKKLLGRAS
jgi:hypothetical protein